MRKDSERILEQLLQYRKEIEKDSFEVNYRYFNNIPNIESAMSDILKDLIGNNCITSQSRVIDLEGNISINLTLDGIQYFDEVKPKENISQITYNVFPFGQVVSGYDNAQVNVGTNKDSNEKIKHKIKSRTQEYADKWNSNMFLNDFDEWDKKTGINIKLKDIYVEKHLPHFVQGENEDKFDNLKKLLSKYIVERYQNKMLLILGQPGIGKSTLITWITANFTDKIDNILVYRFTDLKDIDWQAYDVSNRILEELNLSHENLNEKILIFDGFDEVNVEGDRKDVLDKIYWELIRGKSIKKLSIIITCRENYIQNLERISCKYIILQTWDEKQIQSFCKVFQDKTKTNMSKNTLENILVNKEILGIPLILYMVLSLNISIEKERSIVDVYDKIFSLEGGIYDRCIDNKSYENPHWIKEIKRQIHQMSREIAVWMFENNSEKASILQEEYQKICDIVMKGIEQKDKDIKQDFLIGSYFRKIKHCEGIETEEIYFVHRSIYEYFVAETIYNSIEKSVIELSETSQEKLAGNIAWYLKQGEISITIGEYLQHKILKLYNKLTTKKRNEFYQWWENTVYKMMDYGMFYYTNVNIKEYNNIIHKECQCFMNLLEILRLIIGTSKKKYIMVNKSKEQLKKYLNYCCAEFKTNSKNKKNIFSLKKLFLKKIDLAGEYLLGIDLCEANLTRAYLNKTNLMGCNLQRTNLKYANLREADLRNADLREANFWKANLTKANLYRAFLIGGDMDEEIAILEETEVNLQGANLQASIWHKDDIQKLLHQLKETRFKYLIAEDENGQKKVYRKELFPDEQ